MFNFFLFFYLLFFFKKIVFFKDMHIHLIILPDRSKTSDHFYLDIIDKKTILKNWLKSFAKYYNDKVIEYDQNINEKIYFPKCDLTGYQEYPFFIYSGHYIYIGHEGFDFVDFLVGGIFNGETHAIFIGKTREEYTGDLLEEYNSNLTFFKDFSKEMLDAFIEIHS